MLAQLLDWQRASLKDTVARAHGALAPLDGTGALGVYLNHVLINLAAGELQEHDLAAAVRRDAGQPVRADVLSSSPFVRLVALRLARSRRPARRILFIAPYSGYAATVLSPLLAALLEDAEVVVTDWRDARLAALAAGPFGLDQQVGVLLAAMRELGPNLHVVALSQAAVAALAASALLAPDKAAAPRSLALVGGPIDATRGVSSFNTWFLHVPPDALAMHAFSRVGEGYPGAGRLVLPSLYQLLLVATAHLGLYVLVQSGSLVEALFGARLGYRRSLSDLHALIDTPAELVVQMWHDVFCESLLMRGGMRVDGRAVRPERIERTALFTIAAEQDALVGPQQTHAAHEICTRLGAKQRARLTLSGAGHPDLFTGPIATRVVAPSLQRFMVRTE